MNVARELYREWEHGVHATATENQLNSHEEDTKSAVVVPISNILVSSECACYP